jgi:peptidoglycan/LPS O-acetylase OafA/YrhL
MTRVDDVYIGLGLVWLLAGMVLGAWLGAAGQFQFTNTHAHMNLVGFVISVAFGLIYRGYPAMKRSRFAWPQLALYQAGAVLLVGGKAILDSGGSLTMVKIGAAVIILGVVAMVALFVARKSEINAPAPFMTPSAPL